MLLVVGKKDLCKSVILLYENQIDHQHSEDQMIKAIMSLLLLTISAPSYAIVSIGLSGANSTSNFSLETQDSSIISANISLGIASFLQVGLTHRRSFQKKTGLKKQTLSDNTSLYYQFIDNTDIITNSLDLTVILYKDVVSPFIFGGIAKRHYFTELETPFGKSSSSKAMDPVPNYGLGLAIQVNSKFSIKITRTYTPGLKTDLVDGEERDQEVLDTYTQVGIGYRI